MSIQRLICSIGVMVNLALFSSICFADTPNPTPGSAPIDCNATIGSIDSPAKYAKLLACRCAVNFSQADDSGNFQVPIALQQASHAVMADMWINNPTLQGCFSVPLSDNAGTTEYVVAGFVKQGQNGAVCYFYNEKSDAGDSCGHYYQPDLSSNSPDYSTCARASNIISQNLNFVSPESTNPGCAQ